MSAEVVVITGPVGAGKTTAMGALAEFLSDQGQAVAMIDLDSLRAVWRSPVPGNPDDPFHAQLGIANLKAIWPNFAERSVHYLLLTDAVEHPDQRNDFLRAVPGGRVTIVRLEIPLQIVHERLRGRESGASLEWHLHRSGELQRLMTDRGVGDIVLTLGEESPAEIAALIAYALRSRPNCRPEATDYRAH